MKLRRTIIATLAVALAFAGSVGPRHARAAVQGHDQAAATSHSHEHSAPAKHSHEHQAAADSHFGENGTHDHAGSQPATDQGCCVAWCSSAAIIDPGYGLMIPATSSALVSLPQPVLVTASLSSDDPPPR